MIKTIIFDIGGVVVHSDFKTIYSNFGERIGLGQEFVIKYHNEKVHDLLLGNITLGQFWKDMIDAGANPELDLRNIWMDEGIKNREVNEELLLIIKKLRRKYLVGTLTNLTPSRLILDEKMDLYSHFDYAVLSCKEHLKKPDPEFYKLCLKIASANPEEAVFIDDKESCTGPAEEIGMKGILYTYPDNAKLFEELKQLGVFI
jgi:putative hydrolase of the HAD superfamily